MNEDGDALSSIYEPVLYEVHTSNDDQGPSWRQATTKPLTFLSTSSTKLEAILDMPTQAAQPADAGERESGLSVRSGR